MDENKISVSWGVNTSHGSETFDLDDLSCRSMSEWYKLSEAEREKRIQAALDALPERVYIVLDDWSEN